MDLDELIAVGRRLVEGKPRTPGELGELLQQRWPDWDVAWMVFAIRAKVPLVQIPPRTVWGQSGQTVVTSAEAWPGQSLSEEKIPDDLVMRYIGAFGPVRVNDIHQWSGLTRLRDSIGRLRERLVRFKDETGVELFDLPEAPRPDSETPAPARFLPELDNLLISFNNFDRIVASKYKKGLMSKNGIIPATFLVDGFVRGNWKLSKKKKETALVIQPFEEISGPNRDALAEEGEKLLEFATPNHGTEIRFEPVHS